MKIPKFLAFRLAFLIAVLSASLTALPGCQSYDIVQSNIFADDAANIVRVDYGRSLSDHENTFLAPNGKELTFKSKLVVRVTLPDGDDFTAWQCMNVLPGGMGTLYRTDDEEWFCHVQGFSCRIYHQNKKGGQTAYAEVFRGILCESPKTDFEPDEKWRKLKKDAEGKWK